MSRRGGRQKLQEYTQNGCTPKQKKIYAVYPFIFACHKVCKNGEMCNFFNLGRSFLQFKKFLTKNITGYNFCVLNILQYKSDRENEIFTKIAIYMV